MQGFIAGMLGQIASQDLEKASKILDQTPVPVHGRVKPDPKWTNEELQLETTLATKQERNKRKRMRRKQR